MEGRGLPRAGRFLVGLARRSAGAPPLPDTSAHEFGASQRTEAIQAGTSVPRGILGVRRPDRDDASGPGALSRRPS